MVVRLVIALGDAMLDLGGTLEAAVATAFDFRHNDQGAGGERTGLRAPSDFDDVPRNDVLQDIHVDGDKLTLRR